MSLKKKLILISKTSSEDSTSIKLCPPVTDSQFSELEISHLRVSQEIQVRLTQTIISSFHAIGFRFSRITEF